MEPSARDVRPAMYTSMAMPAPPMTPAPASQRAQGQCQTQCQSQCQDSGYYVKCPGGKTKEKTHTGRATCVQRTARHGYNAVHRVEVIAPFCWLPVTLVSVMRKEELATYPPLI
jgi:hypothetical protein